MESSEEKKYALISGDDFLSIFKDSLNLVEKEYMFITRAYYERDDVVAIYEEEGEKDCYFQLPEYRSKLVPHERRYIYFLPKNTLQNVCKSNSPDGRFNIEVNQLIKIADPYLQGEKVLEKQNNTQENPINIYSQLGNLSKLELAMLITKATAELLTKE